MTSFFFFFVIDQNYYDFYEVGYTDVLVELSNTGCIGELG